MKNNKLGLNGSTEVYHFENGGGNKGGIIAPVDSTDENFFNRISAFSRLMREKQNGTVLSVESKTFAPGTKTNVILDYAIHGERSIG